MIEIDWHDFTYAFWVSRGNPLIRENNKNSIVSPTVYGTGETYHVAAAVKFAYDIETDDFGSYVHFEAGQTYTLEFGVKVETDRDFYCGYVAAAIAIRAQAMKTAKAEELVMAKQS